MTDTLRSILDTPSEEIEQPTQPQPQSLTFGRPLGLPDWPGRRVEWQHPASEAERLTEIEDFLTADFDLFREVTIACSSLSGSVKCRVDLLAVPKAFDLAIAIEVKGEKFDLERALKQSADYVGGRILEGPHIGKQIIASFLYPGEGFRYYSKDPYIMVDSARYNAMFNLIAQWRVGRGFIDPYYHELTLAFGFVVIWRSKRGWTSKASDMLLGKRTFGGSRR
jgi:hypothetical protein